MDRYKIAINSNDEILYNPVTTFEDPVKIPIYNFKDLRGRADTIRILDDIEFDYSYYERQIAAAFHIIHSNHFSMGARCPVCDLNGTKTRTEEIAVQKDEPKKKPVIGLKQYATSDQWKRSKKCNPWD